MDKTIAIDPSKAQGYINGLRSGDARLAGDLFVITNPQLLSCLVVLLKPGRKSAGERKKVISNYAACQIIN